MHELNILNIFWSLLYYILGVVTGGVFIYGMINIRKTNKISDFSCGEPEVSLSIDKYT